jgi:hypothetical protein
LLKPENKPVNRLTEKKFAPDPWRNNLPLLLNATSWVGESFHGSIDAGNEKVSSNVCSQD